MEKLVSIQNCSLNVLHISKIHGKLRSYLPAVCTHFSGDGKTHYIKEQLQLSTHSLTIAVNEAFTPLNAIKKLRQLQPSQRDCAIFLNFTMLPPGVSLPLPLIFPLPLTLTSLTYCQVVTW